MSNKLPLGNFKKIKKRPLYSAPSMPPWMKKHNAFRDGATLTTNQKNSKSGKERKTTIANDFNQSWCTKYKQCHFVSSFHSPHWHISPPMRHHPKPLRGFREITIF